MHNEEISLRHQFSIDELANMGREQAGKLDQLASLKLELDSVKKQYNSQIAEAEAGVSRISTRVHAGWEMRTVRCVAIDERPEGYRLFVRLDNGHVAKRRRLDTHERQLELTTEAPRQFVAVAVLHVDDEAWDTDAFEVPLYADEFEALRTLDVISMREWSDPKGYLGEKRKKDDKKQ